MGVSGSAAAQSLEELHRVVSTAVIQRRPIAAVYDGVPRLSCPNVLGYNDPGEYRVSVIDTEGRAGTDRSHTSQRGSGAGLHWRNSGASKCWMDLGKPDLTLANDA